MFIHTSTLKRCIILLFSGIAVGVSLRVFCFDTISQVFLNRNAFTVVCDAGHGSPDGGAVADDGTQEKDINLAITTKLVESLEGMGIQAVVTREGDSGIYDENATTIRQKKVDDMHKRLDIINKSGANLFLSIHMNSFTDTSARGIHIFYANENEDTIKLAEEIQRSIVGITNAKSHDIKHANTSLYLMKNAKIPSILIECGFMSNPQEAQLLKQEEYQAKIAWAIASAVKKHIN